MEKILVTIPVGEKHKKQLEEAAPGFIFDYVAAEDVAESQVRAAEIIIGKVPPSYIAASEKLRLLQLSSAGTDGYTAAGILSEKTILTNATGAYGKSVAEHMFGVMMVLQKKLHLYRDDQIKGEWNDYGSVTSVADACVMIVGLGDIGTHFAGMVKALGAYVIGVKRRPAKRPEVVDELVLNEEMQKVLPRADIVLSVLPNTEATYHLYDQEFFTAMKRTGIFLNAGRGNAVNQEDLLKALQTGEIAGAGLDVTDPEPLPSSHPLWREKNVFITPHVSGQFHLPGTLDRIVEIAAGNISACLNNQPLKNIIDFETGYCQ